MNISQQSQPQPSPLMTLLSPIYKWLVIIPVLGLSTFIIGSIVILLSYVGQADFASRIFGTLWARVNMLTMLMSIEVTGRKNISQGQSYIVIANHQSLTDIYVLYGYLGLDIKWIMKKELRAVPVLGAACAAMGHIIIDRSDTDKALATINTAKSKITDGMSVIFFPEGTRSRDGSLQSFKKGAFRLAIELGVPILPVSIHGTNKVLPSDTMSWQPGQVKLQIHEPIATASLSNDAVNQLIDKSYQVLKNALD